MDLLMNTSAEMTIPVASSKPALRGILLGGFCAGLADFIYREVTKLTNSRQKPFYYISSMENILLAQP